jgi:hypothetical protein
VDVEVSEGVTLVGVWLGTVSVAASTIGVWLGVAVDGSIDGVSVDVGLGVTGVSLGVAVGTGSVAVGLGIALGVGDTEVGVWAGVTVPTDPEAVRVAGIGTAGMPAPPPWSTLSANKTPTPMASKAGIRTTPNSAQLRHWGYFEACTLSMDSPLSSSLFTVLIVVRLKAT